MIWYLSDTLKYLKSFGLKTQKGYYSVLEYSLYYFSKERKKIEGHQIFD